MNKLSTV